MIDNKITVNKIILIIAYLLLVCFCAFNISPLNSTNSYLTSTDNFVGTIEVAGLEYRVYQNITGAYEDITNDGINLGRRPFATDETYTYDVILKNDDATTSTAMGFYVRWKYVAIIDGEETNINFAVTTGANSYLSGEYFYFVSSGSTLDSLDAQMSVSLLNTIKFNGNYDEATDSYGSILDDKFAGSTFQLKLYIEGSQTAFY